MITVRLLVAVLYFVVHVHTGTSYNMYTYVCVYVAVMLTNEQWQNYFSKAKSKESDEVGE